MSSDADWERWGRQDPYFGVITDARFRANTLTPADRAAFFETGFHHVAEVMATCRRLFGAGFKPQRVLDFGCGVGRLVVPFGRIARQVVGVDVSSGMLEEAARNCHEHGLVNVELLPSDDQLSRLGTGFDLVHSVITLQHIEASRGLQILRQLLQRIAPGGVGAVQFTYAKAWHEATLGQPPVSAAPSVSQPLTSALGRLLRRNSRPGDNVGTDASPPPADPAMHMHVYPLNEVAYLLQTAGVRGFHTEFTDHGGEMGVFLYFQVPARPAIPAAPEA